MELKDILPTVAEIEIMMVEAQQAGTTTRTKDGELRTYYASFSLTKLAEHIHRELWQRATYEPDDSEQRMAEEYNQQVVLDATGEPQ